MIYEVKVGGKKRRLEISRANGHWQCTLDGRALAIDAALLQPNVLSILIEGKSYAIKRERVAGDVHLWVGPQRYPVELSDPRSLRSRQTRAAGEGPQKLVAQMPGKVVRVLVGEHAQVNAGQGVLVVEAMKMQNEIKSPKKGVIARIVAVEGSLVNAGDVLAVVE